MPEGAAERRDPGEGGSVLVFAYGSNLCPERLRRRTPSARSIGAGYVVGRVLRFHTEADDGSGKADACPSESRDARVWGAVYSIASSEKPDLDRAERLGVGYREVTATVHLRDGSTLSATLYEALRRDPSLKPYDWYHRLVVEGARAHDLPEPYVEALESVPAVDDPDRERDAFMRGIDCGAGPGS